MDDPAWLSYFDEAYLAARMAQCFRDLGEAGHAARYARRSLDMDGHYVRGRAFNLNRPVSKKQGMEVYESASAPVPPLARRWLACAVPRPVH